jgi:hypothetical protein
MPIVDRRNRNSLANIFLLDQLATKGDMVPQGKFEFLAHETQIQLRLNDIVHLKGADGE